MIDLLQLGRLGARDVHLLKLSRLGARDGIISYIKVDWELGIADLL